MKHKITQALWVPAVLCAAFAQAENSSQIEELVVTASPHGKRAEDIAGTIDSLSGRELQQAVANTLGETLKGQLGVNTSSFGPGVGVPVIRGLSGNRVEILQNNSPLADASSTSPDHAIALEPLLADRIEILRGPATLRFGPGAIGGVINIIDDRIHLESFTGTEGAVETRYDSNGNGAVVVGRMDVGNGLYSGHISGMSRDTEDTEIPGLAAQDVDDPADTTDGHIANTDLEADAFNLGISRTTDEMVVGFAVSRVNNDYGIPPGAHAHHADEQDSDGADEEYVRIDMEQTEYSGRLQLPALSGFFSALFLDLSHTDYEHSEVEIVGIERQTGTRYETDSDNLRLELTYGDAGSWLGNLGVQYNDTGFGSIGEEAFVPANDTSLPGAFITAERDLAGGTVELGMRYDHQSAEADHGPEISHDLVNASASYLYPIDDANQLGIVFAHAQRAPSAEELFAQGEHVAVGRYQVGDTGLDREASNNIELTWRYTGTVDLTTSVFHREFADFIFETGDGTFFSHDLAAQGVTGALACSGNPADFETPEEFDSAQPCSFTQQEDARFSGVETELVAPLNDNVELRLWGDLVNARLDDSGDVPRIPPARLGGEVDFTRGLWSGGLAVTHGFKQDDPGNFESETGSYSRLDCHLGIGTDDWQVFINGNNLTDEEIRNATSFLRELAPEPGRSIELGGRIHF